MLEQIPQIQLSGIQMRMNIFYKVIVILFFLWLWSPETFSQQREIDSLQQIIREATDTSKVNTLNKLAYKVMFSAPQDAEKYTSESIELARSIKFYKGLIHAYQLLGISLDVRGDYPKAIEAYEKGFSVYQKSGINHQLLYVALCNGMGVAFYHQGSYQQALNLFLKGLKLVDELGDINKIATFSLNIGLIHHDQKEFETALNYYLKSMNQAEMLGDKVLIGRVANNIGIIYKEMDKYDEAYRYLQQSLEMKKYSNDRLGMSATLTNLAAISKRKKEYKEALDYLNQAEQLKNQVDDKAGLVIVNDLRSEILIAQNKLQEAEALINKNYASVMKLGGENRLLVYERFHDLYKAKGDYKNALHWYVKLTAYHDSLFNINKSKQLAELQTLYDVSKKDAAITLLEKESAAERFLKNSMIILFGSFLLVVIVIGYSIRFRIRKKQEMHDLQLKIHENTIENAALREEKLEKEIQFKNKELASYTMNFVQKSELMEELKRNVLSIVPEDTVTSKKLASITKLIDSNYQVDREWEDFKLQFENVHANFFKQLKERYPELTNGDLKLCALLKLNMNMKEAARILGISPESVKTARYRLRKKFELTQDANLVDFILNVENDGISIDGEDLSVSA